MRARALAGVALFAVVAACGSGAPVTPVGTPLPTTITTLAPMTQPPGEPGTPGGIDTTFGDGGQVMFDMGGTDDHAYAVAVTADGSTIVAGEARADDNSLVTFALAKLTPVGSLDASFGDGGKVYTPFDAFSSSGALAVAVQSDGKIVAAGHAANPEAHHQTFALARYNVDGSLDSTFGNGGLVLTAIWPETGAGPEDRANDVAIDGQGRIVVAGETGNFFYDFAVARYLPDGSLDESFGDGGVVTTDLGGDDRANSVAVDADGSILLGGTGGTSAGTDFVLVRYLDDGTPDAAFGPAMTDFRGGDDVAHRVLVRPDGTLVLVGTNQLSGGCSPATCERYGFGMAQYDSGGALDGGFGTGGKIEPDFIVSSGAYDAVLMADGTVALVGHIGNEDFGLAFADPLGAPILIENGSEAARIDFQGGSDRAFGAALGPNNTVVLAGDASAPDGSFDWGVARYTAPTAP